MKTDYTTWARRVYLRHPLLSDIGIQINFWICAYSLFFAIQYFISMAVASLYPFKVEVYLWDNLVVALIVAIPFGALLGTIDFYAGKKLRGWPLGAEILVKGLFYLVVWFFILLIASFLGKAMEARTMENPVLSYTGLFTRNMYWAASLYTAVMVIVISFIRQMNIKFGPGVLLPMLAGKYRTPHVEERVFLFMDLKDSTPYAERLGHLRFSELIQRCFSDVNDVVRSFNAEIYQYVGDEVVLTWSGDEGLRNMNCVRFFFAFRRRLAERREEYESAFGFTPHFKAGAHIGNITVAEVGEYKRDIAYHGDTINTAARIQSVCNTYNETLLISEELKRRLSWDGMVEVRMVDSIRLKGKQQKVRLYGVGDHAHGNSMKREILLKGVYEPAHPSDGCRILVERLWPRGISKTKAKIDLWAKDITPSTQLRRWFNHDPSKWTEFRRRYFGELKAGRESLEPVLERLRTGPVTFVFSSREKRFNNAVALRDYLERSM